jgi:indolepyruvate ferredoxin oxidoreductase beta subunit
MADNGVCNVILAGLGGQGVVTAADVVADAAFRAGYDVKKAEIHGMSQRGGSVSSDVRFGTRVLSPMVPLGEGQFLVVVDEAQVEPHRHRLAPDGRLITPADIDAARLAHKRGANVALLGVLSRDLPIAAEHWRAALAARFKPEFHEANWAAFSLGRDGERRDGERRDGERRDGGQETL